MPRYWLFATAVMVAPLTASADTGIYAYDALGRLVGACQMPAGNERRTEYIFDRASNRMVVRSLPVVVVIPAATSIFSSDGRFQLAMQTDGNLVVYGPSGPLWSSSTYGTGSNNMAVMQADGNFVIYTQAGVPVWSSQTGSNCARISMQTDGNLVIYDLSLKPIWATGTGGH